MQRHPLHVAVAAIAIGLALAGRLELTVIVAAGVALGLAAWRAPQAAATAAVLIACASVLGGARVAAIDRSELHELIGSHVEASGYLVRRERSSFGTRRMRVELTRVGTRQVAEKVQLRVPARVRMRAASIGDELAIEGELTALPASKGDFDYRAYLMRAGVHAVLRADRVESTGARRGGVTGFVDGVRRRAEAGVAAGLDPPLRQLALGMVLGEDEQIPDEVSDDFKASGLAHVLAVSGQNVTLLALLAWPLLGLAGVGRRKRLAVILVLIAIYVPLTGAGPSILRAGVMGSAATVAALSGRPGSRWYALLLSAAVTLAIDPRAWLDVGWQLSFAAVAGIFVLMGPLTRALRKVPEALREGLAMTIAATVATAPLMAFQFGRLSIASLVANVVALPAIAPVMWAGMIDSLLAQASVPAALPVNIVAEYCLAYVAAVAHWSARLPGAVAEVELGSVWWLAAAYAGLAAIVFVLTRPGRLKRRPPPFAAALLAVALAALVAVVTARGRDLPDTAGRFSATFIDVGQGDATLLRTPRGASVLIDGGVPEAGVRARLGDLGVKRLDIVVLTHPERDHEGGLLDVLQHVPVRLLLDGGRGAPTAEHRAILAAAHSRNVDVTNGRTGAAFALDGLRLRIVSPPLPYHAGDAPNNDQAIVLLASYRGFDMLLPADAESNVTGSLQLPRVELLKVAHHGSADEGLARLLQAISPDVAVIEVGAGNSYGHPTPSALAALQAVPRVYRTDRDGNVTVIPEADGPHVDTSN